MNPANILAILEIVDRLLKSAGRYAAVARQAAAEGRDVSDAELEALKAEDDAAAASLAAAIAARRAADAGGGGV
jgi:hypothetical protein